MNKRTWQILFGVAYVALFLFLFVVKPVPEQKLKASIGIEATEAEVSALLKSGHAIRTLLVENAAEPLLKGGVYPWAEVGDDWAALLLTKAEATDVSLETRAGSRTPRVVLTVETHWQVRGGLLGKALDQVVGRRARMQALAFSLRHVKAEAEQMHRL